MATALGSSRREPLTAGREGDEALAATAYVPEDVNAKNLGDVNSHGEDERGAGTRACMADGETMAAEVGVRGSLTDATATAHGNREGVLSGVAAENAPGTVKGSKGRSPGRT